MNIDFPGAPSLLRALQIQRTFGNDRGMDAIDKSFDETLSEATSTETVSMTAQSQSVSHEPGLPMDRSAFAILRVGKQGNPLLGTTPATDFNSVEIAAGRVAGPWDDGLNGMEGRDADAKSATAGTETSENKAQPSNPTITLIDAAFVQQTITKTSPDALRSEAPKIVSTPHTSAEVPATALPVASESNRNQPRGAIVSTPDLPLHRDFTKASKPLNSAERISTDTKVAGPTDGLIIRQATHFNSPTLAPAQVTAVSRPWNVFNNPQAGDGSACEDVGLRNPQGAEARSSFSAASVARPFAEVDAQVESVPVSSPAPPIAVPAPVLQQIVNTISHETAQLAAPLPNSRADVPQPQSPSAASLLRTVSIELDPPELGKLVIEIDLRDRELKVRISVSDSSTAVQLKDDQDSLSTALRAAGYSIDNVLVQNAGHSAPRHLSQPVLDSSAQQNQPGVLSSDQNEHQPRARQNGQDRRQEGSVKGPGVDQVLSIDFSGSVYV